jgi:hypothetical protein
VLHPRPAGLLRATVASLLIAQAACAHAPAAFAFEVVPRAVPVHHSHRLAWGCALAGAGLVGASFPLTTTADHRYHAYLRETNPDAIPGRWNASVRADRVASSALFAGEALLVTGTWLGFIHRPHDSRVALEVGRSRCALSCRF